MQLLSLVPLAIITNNFLKEIAYKSNKQNKQKNKQNQKQINAKQNK